MSLSQSSWMMIGWFIDLTLNQFAKHRERVVIDDRTGTLGTLRRRIHDSGGTVTERGILPWREISGT
ncbi:hypothetical protein AAQ05_004989 [Salmonella enterica subsp. diarizonae]|nr:hypothetical protein [Salmonella enterica subsp. diarizonae]